jgi:NADPH:quinone reductase-like Zn-dependent oxidoreductase
MSVSASASFLVSMKAENLLAPKELIEARKFTPVMDRNYPLRAASAAIAQVSKGHARGMVAITV